MQYISTRGLESSFSFSDILFEGYAEDGGLYVPAVFPKVDAHTLMTWRGPPMPSLASRSSALRRGAPEGGSLADLLRKPIRPATSATRVYVHGRGDHAREVAPRPGRPARALNGPTLAFDDIALQFMSRLFDTSFAQGRRARCSAPRRATWGLRPRPRSAGTRTSRSSCFPEGPWPSQFQAAQLYSNQDPNVVNIEVNGTFDECQDIVRTILEDREYAKAHGLGAINSVLWARIVPQIVYYFYGYLRAVERVGEEVVFAVPGGNFGNAYACWVAKKMGLPIMRLIVCTNENDAMDESSFAYGSLCAEALERDDRNVLALH